MWQNCSSRRARKLFRRTWTATNQRSISSQPSGHLSSCRWVVNQGGHLIKEYVAFLTFCSLRHCGNLLMLMIVPFLQTTEIEMLLETIISVSGTYVTYSYISSWTKSLSSQFKWLDRKKMLTFYQKYFKTPQTQYTLGRKIRGHAQSVMAVRFSWGIKQNTVNSF